MKATLSILFATLLGFFRSRTALQLKNMALRHQLIVLQRRQRCRPQLYGWDRMIWAWLSSLWSGWRDSLVIVKPETVIRWCRGGFKLFWKLKSHHKRQGRPTLSRDIRDLILRMSAENPLWGAPRIHGELLKLGYAAAESSVAKYMVKPDKPPSQTWKTFLYKHADQIVAMDFFTTPTIFFKVLHVLVFLDHERRRILHFNVTTKPTAAWVAQQIRDAFPWDTAPRFFLHDRDPIFMANQGGVRSLGMETIVTALGSPWQNAYCERVIGSIRRECLDHLIVLNENHLRRVLGDYLIYYHDSRTHLGLYKDCPDQRPVQPIDAGKVIAIPYLGGLHHQYLRKAA